MEAEGKPVRKSPRAAKETPANAKSGVARMQSEVRKVLKSKGPAIAESIGNKAVEGDLKCAEFLYKLAQDHAAEDEGAAKTCSVVARLASEPEWSEEDAQRQSVEAGMDDAAKMGKPQAED